MSRHTIAVRYREYHPRSAGLLADAHALGLTRITRIECQELFFIEGQLDGPQLGRLAAELLSDPVAQTYEWRSVTTPRKPGRRNRPGFSIIETAFRSGVTDTVAAQLVRAAHEQGFSQVERAATGYRYWVWGRLSKTELHQLAGRLLANPVIHNYALGAVEPGWASGAAVTGPAVQIPIRALTLESLAVLSQQRRAALDLEEMASIQEYFKRESRDPTDVEFEMIAQTWSEHCSHKTFKARIALEGPSGESVGQIDNLLNTYLRSATDRIAAPWVRSAFVDNAGILDFGDGFDVSFKVETHNHPSAIEPFGGANTGVGGVIRDILGVSAKPIAATDVLCFGPSNLSPRQLPDNVLHPRLIRSGVVSGVQDYGNKIGIPTINGAILYDPAYTANPLVFCGCVGLAPAGRHAALRHPRPGDRVMILGGRTGRDGLRGATFSSMTIDAQTGQVAGASVQIGDPITEKGLIEVIVRARDQGLYHAVTDCGAGGLSSAVGEMAAEYGCEVDLSLVRLKYEGLQPWEIWLSEAQERMVLAVPPESAPSLSALCEQYDVEMMDIGSFTESGRIVARFAGDVVLDLSAQFLHKGAPQRRLTALLSDSRSGQYSPPCDSEVETQTPSARLLSLLADPNIASKTEVIRLFDHEVQGGTVVKPLTGRFDDGPSDACVLRPLGATGRWGLVISNGINPQLGKQLPYAMALNVVDEAIRNAVAVGADPEHIALLDNFCWGDPLRPETLGAMVAAAHGCHDAALHFRAPFISGKDSLNNEYVGADGLRHAIPPTLLISALGRIEDIRAAVTLDLKAPGNLLYLVGEVTSLTGPLPDAGLYRALHRAITAGLVRSCHDLSEGGLAVTAAEMAIAGRLGLAITTDVPIFTETNGCLLAEIGPDRIAEFERAMAGQSYCQLGLVTASPRLNISTRTSHLISVSVVELVEAWMAPAAEAQ
jgi:phosphoribosylformylglycinamidine synthase II